MTHDWLGWAAVIAAALPTIIQISPIKINPWTALARGIGRAINGEMLERMDKLEKNVESMQYKMGERAAKDARVRILRFGDELLHNDGRMPSKEHFDQILMDITEYERYCHEHPEFKNNMTKLTTKHIQEMYLQLYEDGGFQ